MRNIAFKPLVKRDMKRMARRGDDLERLIAMAKLIAAGEQLPRNARPHKLSGEYEGKWECHIAHDWLLIYKISGNELLLARTGTHADLFEWLNGT